MTAFNGSKARGKEIVMLANYYSLHVVSIEMCLTCLWDMIE